MTTMTIAETAIKQALLDADWPSPVPPIGFQNETIRKVPEYLTVDIDYNDVVQETMGAAPYRRFKNSGVAVVQIFVRPDEGTTRAMALAETVLAALEGTTAGEVIFRASLPQHKGRLGAWYVLEIRASFDYPRHK